MTAKLLCKICNAYSGKMKVCKKCKSDIPGWQGQEGGEPFDRKKEYEKRLRGKKK